MKIWQKTIAVVSTFALLFNSVAAPLSVLAQEATPEPTPEATVEPSTTPEATPTDPTTPTPEATIEATATPEVTPDATPTEIATPTPEVTPDAMDSASLTTSPAAQPIETQAPESNPTVQGPPTATPTVSTENGHISAVVLENAAVDTSAITQFDLTYQTDGSATISTDKLDYSPTDTAVITGVGFTARKTYTINITSSDEPVVNFSDSVKANDKGEILYSYTLDGTYRPNYQVKIKDLERVVARTSFTDAKPQTLTLGSQVGTITSGIGGSSTYSLSLSFNGNGSSCTANLSVSGLTTGVTIDASHPQRVL